MRYFFHVRSDRSTFDDDRGEFLAGVEQASIHAAVIAGEIAQDGDWIGFSVLVTDESGTEIVRLPITETISGPHRLQ